MQLENRRTSAVLPLPDDVGTLSAAPLCGRTLPHRRLTHHRRLVRRAMHLVRAAVPLLAFASPFRRARCGDAACCAAADAWSADEDFTLLSMVPLFTTRAEFSAGTAECVTFWSALLASAPALRERSAAECLERTSILSQQSGDLRYGAQPPVLEGWSRLADGRYAGSVETRSVWLNVRREGTLASDLPGGTGYVELLSGRIFELGRPEAREESSVSSGALQAGGAASAGGAGGLVIDDSKVWGPLRVFLPGQAEGEGRPWFLKYLLPGWGCLFLAEICVVVNSVASSAGA